MCFKLHKYLIKIPRPLLHNSYLNFTQFFFQRRKGQHQRCVLVTQTSIQSFQLCHRFVEHLDLSSERHVRRHLFSQSKRKLITFSLNQVWIEFRNGFHTLYHAPSAWHSASPPLYWDRRSFANFHLFAYANRSALPVAWADAFPAPECDWNWHWPHHAATGYRWKCEAAHFRQRFWGSRRAADWFGRRVDCLWRNDIY